METETTEEKANRRIGFITTLLGIAILPILLAVWFWLWGVAATSYYWMTACFQGT